MHNYLTQENQYCFDFTSILADTQRQFVFYTYKLLLVVYILNYRCDYCITITTKA